uniref:Uncharacterized protein n=1 Tax=Oryza punctata TaxID=4537 RepID=A0A0E0LTX2_ORYPU
MGHLPPAPPRVVAKADPGAFDSPHPCPSTGHRREVLDPVGGRVTSPKVGAAAATIPFLILLSSPGGFIWIWIVFIYMSIRAFASTWMMGAARGAWTFLRK